MEKFTAYLVFSWMEQSCSSFLLQMVMTCLERSATVAMSDDQITYRHCRMGIIHI